MSSQEEREKYEMSDTDVTIRMIALILLLVMMFAPVLVIGVLAVRELRNKSGSFGQ